MTTERPSPRSCRHPRIVGCALLLAFWGCNSEKPPGGHSDLPVVESPVPSVSPAAAEPAAAGESSGEPARPSPMARDRQDVWTALFDGQHLGGWSPSNFATQGEVTLQDDAIRIEGGDTCSGITWKGTEDLPHGDYELQLQAKRVKGRDFFCGLTFPVNEDCCSLIVGGWGGGLVGLSCLDGYDASENNTSSWQKFDQDTWYTIRLLVRADHISAWIDDSLVIDVDIEGREVSIRPEVFESKPLGIATWQTSAMFRQIQWRNVPPSRVARP